MRFSTLIPIVSSLSLGLAHNKMGHFWNTTTAQPIPTSGFISTTNSSPLELVATIQIQIGNLSGSGVINLGSVAPASEPAELGNPLTPPSNTSGISNQTEIVFTPCLNASLPSETAAPPYQNSSALNFDITGGYAIPQPTAGPVPANSPTGLGLFTGSGVQSRKLPDMPAFLSAILIWLL
jgi:hypothetical protein